MFILYNYLLHLAYILIHIASFFVKRLRINLQIRREPWPDVKKNSKLFWFHASSVGEYEQVRVLAEAIKESNPEIQLFFTVFSDSAYFQKRNDTLPDYFMVLPFDFYRRMKKLINKIDPAAVFYARYDVWANMARVLHEKKIPQYLVSGTLKLSSGRANILARLFFRKIYGLLSQIFCVDLDNQKRFDSFGLYSTITGDTRYDAVKKKISAIPPAILSLNEKIKSISGKRKIIIGGSTYLRSEKMLLESHHPDEQFLILVPHHINSEHINQIEKEILDRKYNFQKYSLLAQDGVYKINKNISGLVIDATGILPFLYATADIAYVGGGFEGSVHSVLEPLVCKTAIITGPHIENSPEAVELQRKKLLYVLQRSGLQDFQEILSKIEVTSNAIHNEYAVFIRNKEGAVERIMDAIRFDLRLN